MVWEKYLDIVRSGETVIPTSESGIPRVAVNAPVYELKQLMAAMTEGYNRNATKVRMLRKAVKNEMEKCNDL